MPGVKTNEVPGTRAVLRHYRMSAYKAREVLDLVRGKDADRAEEILAATPREAARVVEKVLASALANARNNEQLDPDDLFVSACFADEGTTLKRWRPRARGRATRIRKRTCHITVILSRLPEDKLERRRARQSAVTTGLRSRRVAASRRTGPADVEGPTAETLTSDADVDEIDGTETDAVEERGDAVDGEGTEAEAGLVDADSDIDGDVEEAQPLDAGVEIAGEPAIEAEAEVAAEPEATTKPEIVAEPEAAAEAEVADVPAAKPRRARTARKKTTKAAADADDGDAGAAGDEEKG
jgi:large subunit ribosomal protein L22